MTTPGQGPLNDPRLTERRGDLSGLNAALFVILVVIAFVAAAFLLATVLHLGGAAATPSPSVASSQSPSPSASAPASLSPSASALSGPSPAASAAVGQPFNVVVGGHVVGTITVVSVQSPASVGGYAAQPGTRWLAVRIRYVAKAALTYDPQDWSITDTGGVSHAWAGTDATPALGNGTLKAGAKRSGNVTFQTPLSGALTLIFTGGDSPIGVELPAP